MLIKEDVKLRSIISGTWRTAAIIVLTCTLSSVFNEFVLKNYFEFPTIIPSLLGVALAFFIGFNNNHAYGRWWEARAIMGALTNDCKTLARECIHFISSKQESEKIVYRQIAFAYALNESLRNTNKNLYEKFLNDLPEGLKKARNKPNMILHLQAEHLNALYGSGQIDGFKFMQLNQTINSASSQMGRAERIKNTVFPTTYNYYTKLFIWIFIVSISLALNNSVGMFAIIFSTVIGYVYFVTHKIGQTLLNPFEATPIGIPLDQITRNIEINLKEMLGEKDLPEPTPSVNNEYVL